MSELELTLTELKLLKSLTPNQHTAIAEQCGRSMLICYNLVAMIMDTRRGELIGTRFSAYSKKALERKERLIRELVEILKVDYERHYTAGSIK